MHYNRYFITYSAFADDLIVFFLDYNTIKSLLSVIEEFTGGIGVKLSKTKSISAFNKRGRRKLSGPDNNLRFKEYLKCNEEESFKYLRHQLPPLEEQTMNGKWHPQIAQMRRHIS